MNRQNSFDEGFGFAAGVGAFIGACYLVANHGDVILPVAAKVAETFVALEWRKKDIARFDNWVLSQVEPFGIPSEESACFMDSLSLTIEERLRIGFKFINSKSVFPPQRRPVKRRTGARRLSAKKPLLLAAPVQPPTVQATPSETEVSKSVVIKKALKRGGFPKGSRAKKTNEILKMYDGRRSAGDFDESARGAVTRKLLLDSKRGAKNLRRTVDRAVKKYRNDGDTTLE
jgi:hypothetical protein